MVARVRNLPGMPNPKFILSHELAFVCTYFSSNFFCLLPFPLTTTLCPVPGCWASSRIFASWKIVNKTRSSSCRWWPSAQSARGAHFCAMQCCHPAVAQDFLTPANWTVDCDEQRELKKEVYQSCWSSSSSWLRFALGWQLVLADMRGFRKVQQELGLGRVGGNGLSFLITLLHKFVRNVPRGISLLTEQVGTVSLMSLWMWLLIALCYLEGRCQVSFNCGSFILL